MKGRNIRNHTNRKGFKVDNMLANKEKKGFQDPTQRLKYMNLAFLGFYDKKGNFYLSLKNAITF